MCIVLYKSIRYDMTGYISLVIKLNILNHMMILAYADYSYIALPIMCSCIMDMLLMSITTIQKIMMSYELPRIVE